MSSPARPCPRPRPGHPSRIAGASTRHPFCCTSVPASLAEPLERATRFLWDDRESSVSAQTERAKVEAIQFTSTVARRHGALYPSAPGKKALLSNTHWTRPVVTKAGVKLEIRRPSKLIGDARRAHAAHDGEQVSVCSLRASPSPSREGQTWIGPAMSARIPNYVLSESSHPTRLLAAGANVCPGHCPAASGCGDPGLGRQSGWEKEFGNWNEAGCATQPVG